jgi:hypothetical protein
MWVKRSTAPGAATILREGRDTYVCLEKGVPSGFVQVQDRKPMALRIDLIGVHARRQANGDRHQDDRSSSNRWPSMITVDHIRVGTQKRITVRSISMKKTASGNRDPGSSCIIMKA